MTRLALFISLVGAVATGAPARLEAVDDSEVRSAVEKLLSVGWKRSQTAQRESAETYEQLSTQVPGPRLTYAYALVQMQQQRYRQAIPLVDQVLQVNKKDLDVWKTKVWLLMLTRQFDAALVAMEQLSRLLPPEDVDGEAEQPYEEAARYLGRLFGYLDTVGAGEVGETIRDRQRENIRHRLTTSRRLALQDARQAVIEQVQQRNQQADQMRQQAQQQAQQQQEEQRRRWQLRREQMAKERNEIDERRDRLQSQLQTELNEAARAEQPLVAALARVERGAAVVSRELLLIEEDIVRLLALADRAEDAFQRSQWLREVDRLELLEARYGRDLSVLDAEAARVNGQRVQLRQRAIDARTRHQREIGKLGEEQARLTRVGRRLDIEERQLRRPAIGMTHRVRSLTAHATAFTTYEPFPLEQEKRRFLDSFR